MLTTFALIVIGGVVRVSDSGLGCGAAGSGTEGWPLCGGRALPFLELNALIEFSHRVAATIVAVLIAVLALQALRRLRDHRWLVRGSVAAALLVLAQAALGGPHRRARPSLRPGRRPPGAGDAAARPC